MSSDLQLTTQISDPHVAGGPCPTSPTCLVIREAQQHQLVEAGQVGLVLRTLYGLFVVHVRQEDGGGQVLGQPCGVLHTPGGGR